VRRHSPIGRAGRDRGGDRGSIAIELTASVPLLVICTILLIEGLTAVSAVNAATRAARDGARVAAAGGDGAAAARAQVPGWLRVTSISPTAPGGCAGACITVRVGIPIGLPGIVALTYVPVTRSADFPA
jgi:hypothetical protein